MIDMEVRESPARLPRLAIPPFFRVPHFSEQRNLCFGDTGNSKEEFWEAVDQGQSEGYTVFELWPDHLGEDFDLKFLSEAIDRLGKNLIIPLRRRDKNPIKISFEQGKGIIDFLVEQDAACLVDFDIRMQPEYFEYAKTLPKKPKILASYHNHRSTPSERKLDFIFSDMLEVATVCKFATSCSKEAEANRIQQFYLDNASPNLVTIGMGDELAKRTRVAAIFQGQPLIYAARSTDGCGSGLSKRPLILSEAQELIAIYERLGL